jgi:regulator of protease activity HflC (stomatin/prohibitin superfamily)
MNTKADTTIRHVERLVQKKLDDLETGIKIVPPLQRPDFTWPRQVGAAFRGTLRASNEKERTISQAKLYAEQTLSQTAGPVAQQLFDVVTAKSASSDPNPAQTEQLWSGVAGQAADTLAEAQAYRTKVVEDARASADYLQQILPEYRKRPRLVLQKIYRDAIEQILDSVDEKLVVQPTSEGGQTEFRISISRDQTLKPKLVEPEKK